MVRSGQSKSLRWRLEALPLFRKDSCRALNGSRRTCKVGTGQCNCTTGGDDGINSHIQVSSSAEAKAYASISFRDSIKSHGYDDVTINGYFEKPQNDDQAPFLSYDNGNNSCSRSCVPNISKRENPTDSKMETSHLFIILRIIATSTSMTKTSTTEALTLTSATVLVTLMHPCCGLRANVPVTLMAEHTTTLSQVGVTWAMRASGSWRCASLCSRLVWSGGISERACTIYAERF